MAEIYERCDTRSGARRSVARRPSCRRRFNERFWCEELGCYAFGLDPDKRPIETVASNAGHCLWSGIADPDKAAQVVERLLRPDMWSGWGIRTLTADNPAYNPFSYQLGSVWPHDNGIIAVGFKRYGFAERRRVARDICEAASYFGAPPSGALRRAPAAARHFPGAVRRREHPTGVGRGLVFHLMRAILGLGPTRPRRLYVDPALPRWLPDVTLRGLGVGRRRSNPLLARGRPESIGRSATRRARSRWWIVRGFPGAWTS